MIVKIKSRIENEIPRYLQDLDKLYHISQASPLLFSSIGEYVSRPGKRIRPILFVLGYLGFKPKPVPGLYISALSLELLHDFLLIHDDIIDKSGTRRGKPSMHHLLETHIKKHAYKKFTGGDLAIVIGDVIYAMSNYAFLAIQENARRKETALKRLIEAALHTASGEFMELLCGIKDIESISKEEIYQIYDFKTADYTFAAPLSMGAILAGAKQSEVRKLSHYGILLGRAFQIKDDILGMFGQESKIGKSTLTDLQEAKRTSLIWYAYHHSHKKDRLRIAQALNKACVRKTDLLKVRKIILESGSLDHAKKEISQLTNNANKIISSVTMSPRYKRILNEYILSILKI